MHQSVLDYIKNIPNDKIEGMDVLEVGSQNINGTIRPIIIDKKPRNYLGCDKHDGDGVDIIVPAEKLSCTFGVGTWDVIITTETLEHIQDWQTAIDEMKLVLKDNGLLVITTRSPGFPRHDYPEDYHRFTQEDMKFILRDMIITDITDDNMAQGVFVTACKPRPFVLCDNSEYKVHKAW